MSVCVVGVCAGGGCVGGGRVEFLRRGWLTMPTRWLPLQVVIWPLLALPAGVFSKGVSGQEVGQVDEGECIHKCVTAVHSARCPPQPPPDPLLTPPNASSFPPPSLPAPPTFPCFSVSVWAGGKAWLCMSAVPHSLPSARRAPPNRFSTRSHTSQCLPLPSLTPRNDFADFTFWCEGCLGPWGSAWCTLGCLPAPLPHPQQQQPAARTPRCLCGLPLMLLHASRSLAAPCCAFIRRRVILSITWGLLATIVSTTLPLWEARESLWTGALQGLGVVCGGGGGEGPRWAGCWALLPLVDVLTPQPTQPPNPTPVQSSTTCSPAPPPPTTTSSPAPPSPATLPSRWVL